MARALLLTLLLAIPPCASEPPPGPNETPEPATMESARDAAAKVESSIRLTTEPVADPTAEPTTETPHEPAGPVGLGDPPSRNRAVNSTRAAVRDGRALPATVHGPDARPMLEVDPPEPAWEPESDPELTATPDAFTPSYPSEFEIAPLDEASIPTPPVPALTPEDLVAAARETVGPMVDTLSARLASIERMLTDQNHVSLETQKQSTQTLLVAAGALATAILLGGLLAALILARALRRVSEFVVAALPTKRQLTAGTVLVASNSDLPEPPETPVGAVTQRFLGAMEQLEKRIAELEHTAVGTAPDAAANPPALGDAQPGSGNGGPYEFSVSALNRKQYGPADPATGAATDPAALWLGKGQALLNLGLASDAVECFEKAVALNPACAGDAYVRRGMAFENLQQMEAAIESYDQALAADPTLTLAYLYKGAVCNRLQRYREALDCYDSALQCERKSAGD